MECHDDFQNRDFSADLSCSKLYIKSMKLIDCADSCYNRCLIILERKFGIVPLLFIFMMIISSSAG